MPEGKSFGTYLREKRKQLGLSQSELADRAKIQRTTVSRLESSASNPQWQMIRALIEDGMGISPVEFFKLQPDEARQPVIQISDKTTAPRLAEVMLKTQATAVPVLATDTPLRSQVVTDQDIAGYCVFDHALLKGHKAAALVVWICPPDEGACDWLLADIKDRTLTDGGLFLVDFDQKVEVRRTWLSDKGTLVLDACEADTSKPIAFWGRQRERVEVLGRVVMTSRLYGRT